MMIRFDMALTGVDNDVTIKMTAPHKPRKLPAIVAYVLARLSLTSSPSSIYLKETDRFSVGHGVYLVNF